MGRGRRTWRRMAKSWAEARRRRRQVCVSLEALAGIFGGDCSGSMDIRFAATLSGLFWEVMWNGGCEWKCGCGSEGSGGREESHPDQDAGPVVCGAGEWA